MFIIKPIAKLYISKNIIIKQAKEKLKAQNAYGQML